MKKKIFIWTGGIGGALIVAYLLYRYETNSAKSSSDAAAMQNAADLQTAMTFNPSAGGNVSSATTPDHTISDLIAQYTGNSAASPPSTSTPNPVSTPPSIPITPAPIHNPIVIPRQLPPTASNPNNGSFRNVGNMPPQGIDWLQRNGGWNNGSWQRQ
jgi:hypothetical protein